MNPALVRETITAITGDLLLAKNDAYGNSALDPVRIFSRADPIEQLNVRLDDKLSRLARATPPAKTSSGTSSATSSSNASPTASSNRG